MKFLPVHLLFGLLALLLFPLFIFGKDHVILYSGEDFRGDALILYSGEALSDLKEDRGTLGRNGWMPDGVRSIRVMGNLSVEIFSEADFTGRNLTLSASVPALRKVRLASGLFGKETTWDRMIASLKVRTGGGGWSTSEEVPDKNLPPLAESQVHLFTEKDFRGAGVVLERGREIPDLRGFRHLGIDWANTISSVRVGEGVRLVLYPGAGYTGQSITLAESLDDLSRYRDDLGRRMDFDNRALSLRVVAINNLPVPWQPDDPLEVSVFSDEDFRGRTLALRGGDRVADLGGRGMGDNISSARVGEGLVLVLFEHEDFRGRSAAFQGNIADMRYAKTVSGSRENWHDTASSLQVLKVSEYRDKPIAPGEKVPVGTVFADHGFSGRAVNLYPGERIGNLRQIGLHDNISSLRVSEGYEIQLFEDENFRGRSATFRTDQASLSQGRQSDGALGNWNDTFSSLIVIKR